MRGFKAKSNSRDEYSVMNRVMLRFRPIAPKPTVGDSASGVEEQEKVRNDSVKTARRTKRKYVRARGRQQCARRKIIEGTEKSLLPEKSGIKHESQENDKVTLQLLPERSEDGKRFNDSVQKIQENMSMLMNWNIDQYRFDNDVINLKTADSGITAAFESVRSVTETWIIVECVTDTYTESGVGVGFSDREKINKLQLDTCPGFVSDCTNNVVWVNESCRKMIQNGEEEVGSKDGYMVRLVVKDKLPYYWPSFACRVSVIQQRGQGHKWSRTVPCDVWRMEFAGFAWKLDVRTSLGLGL